MRAVVVLLFSIPLLAQGGNPLLSPGPAPPKHLTLTTGASLSSVKPGARVALFVDIVPNPGIHVYAPGAAGYLPIAMTLASARGVTASSTRYPKSQMLFFAPLKETVPVYRQPFRLARDLSVAASATPGTKLILGGTIDYQACDDTVCFTPESVPVAWTLPVVK